MVIASPVVRVFVKKFLDEAKTIVARYSVRQTGGLNKGAASITDTTGKKGE
jgi:hypothetical protein